MPRPPGREKFCWRELRRNLGRCDHIVAAGANQGESRGKSRSRDSRATASLNLSDPCLTLQMKGQFAENDPEWQRALAYEAEGCQFTAALGVRWKDGQLEPMVPLHSEPLRDLATTQTGRGYRRFYAAVPDHEFVAQVYQVVTAPTAEYGFYVFIDKGQEPALEDFDHYMWWGKNPSKAARTLIVHGYYKNPTQSRAMRFAPAPFDTEVDSCSDVRTSKKARQMKSVASRGAGTSASLPALLPQQEDDEERRKKQDLVGWIVLRIFRVTGYKNSTSGEQPVPKRANLGKDAKPALCGVHGDVIDDEDAVRHPQEPIFDHTALFEIRIKYDTFQAIRCRIPRDLQWQNPGFFRGIPLPTLVENREVRETCRYHMLKHAQRMEAAKRSIDGENVPVKLEAMLDQIDYHFDKVGARMICSQDEDLATLALDCCAQGEPCRVQGLDNDDEEVAIRGLMDHHQKLVELRAVLENQPDKYELSHAASCSSSSATTSLDELAGITVKQAVADLTGD